MECEKCQDRGFVEFEHGLIMQFCDCEKGRALRVEVTGEVAIEEGKGEEGGVLTKEVLQRASDEAGKTPPQAPGIWPLSPQQEEGLEVASDSSGGVEQPDTTTRGEDTRQPTKPRQQEKGKKSTKRTR